MKKYSDYLVVSCGFALIAIALNKFIIPNRITLGGVSGIATVLEYTLRIKPSYVILLINLPLIVAAWVILGRRFVKKSLLGVLILSLFLEITRLEAVTSDLLLASVAGGVIMGFGTGLVILKGSSSGGTEVLVRIINHYRPDISVGRLMLIVDSIIVLGSWVFFKDINLIIYAVIALYVSTNVIDKALAGVDYAKGIYIITTKPEQISRKIMQGLNRGVTGISISGMYTGKNTLMLLCIIRNNQISKLKNIVKAEDENAFVIITDVREVLGLGFKNNYNTKGELK
ncbi:MAG: YitT family protein [Clostridia bacterium]|nr:YitT family protein [Clostridia bacterium]